MYRFCREKIEETVQYSIEFFTVKNLNYLFLIQYLIIVILILSTIDRISIAVLIKMTVATYLYISCLFLKQNGAKKYIYSILSCIILFHVIYQNQVDYNIYKRFVFLLPYMYIYLSDSLSLALLVGVLGAYIFKGYNLLAELKLQLIKNYSCATLYTAIIFKLYRNLLAEKNHLLSISKQDHLTGLLNRRGFLKKSKKKIENIKTETHKLAIIFIDLNRFKQVNDSLGHYIGDLLLIEMARSLEKITDKSDLLSRIAGDEFIILRENKDKIELEEFIFKVIEIFNDNFEIKDHKISITASMGISLFPNHGDDIEQLIQYADFAMNKAKKHGKSHLFYSQQMGLALQNRILENDLKKALVDEEFHLLYQPLIDTNNNQISAVEALIRWKHPSYGLISPGEFIPLAEETRLIIPIGEYVLKTACHQLKSWQDRFCTTMKMSVNISVNQLLEEGFSLKIAEILEETNIKAENLILELVETISAHHKEKVINVLTELTEIGVKISIDDFGSGYSSLAYIKDFPVEYLKIDRSFINGIFLNNKDRAIISTIIELAHSFDLTVVGEGVEEYYQFDFLLQNNCDLLQGFYTGRPSLAYKIEELLLEKEINLKHAY